MAISEKARELAGLPVIDYQPAVGLVLPTMPRRVFRSGDGQATWAITLDRDQLTIEYGEEKRSTAAPTPEVAREQYRTSIQKKVQAGYVEPMAPDATIRDA